MNKAKLKYKAKTVEDIKDLIEEGYDPNDMLDYYYVELTKDARQIKKYREQFVYLLENYGNIIELRGKEGTVYKNQGLYEWIIDHFWSKHLQDDEYRPGFANSYGIILDKLSHYKRPIPQTIIFYTFIAIQRESELNSELIINQPIYLRNYAKYFWLARDEFPDLFKVSCNLWPAFIRDRGTLSLKTILKAVDDRIYFDELPDDKPKKPYSPPPKPPKYIPESLEDLISHVHKESTFLNNQIYFIVDEECRFVKIGISRNPESRVKDLQSGNPIRLEVAYHFPGDGEGEKELHRYLKDYRTIGEWFRVKDELEEFLNSLGYDGRSHVTTGMKPQHDFNRKSELDKFFK